MRLVFFVNNSIKDFTSPTFVPDDGEKGFLLSRFVFAVILENYCQMKGVGNGIYSVHQFIKTEDFKNYALSFLADNFIYTADFGDSMDMISATPKFHVWKTEFDILACCSLVSSSDLSLYIEQYYQLTEQTIEQNKKKKEDKKDG